MSNSFKLIQQNVHSTIGAIYRIEYIQMTKHTKKDNRARLSFCERKNLDHALNCRSG